MAKASAAAAGFRAGHALVDGVGDREGRFELGDPLGERRERRARRRSPPSPASASAPTFAFSSSIDACIACRPRAFAAAASASALSSLACILCSASPICWLMAAASGTEPPSLAASASAFSDCFELRHAGGQLGRLRRRLRPCVFERLDAVIELGERLGVRRRRRRRIRAWRGAPRAWRGPARFVACRAGMRCQAKASAITPIRPPSRPAARWVTKLLSSEMVAAGGGDTLRSPTRARLRLPAPARARPARFARGRLVRLLGSSSGCCRGCVAALVGRRRSTDTSVAVPSMVGAGRLPAPRSYRDRRKGLPSRLNLKPLADSRTLRGCRLGSRSARTSSSRGRAATRTRNPSGLHALCYRLGEAIANRDAALRYRAVSREQSGEDAWPCAAT